MRQQGESLTSGRSSDHTWRNSPGTWPGLVVGEALEQNRDEWSLASRSGHKGRPSEHRVVKQQKERWRGWLRRQWRVAGCFLPEPWQDTCTEAVSEGRTAAPARAGTDTQAPPGELQSPASYAGLAWFPALHVLW